jgi:hypothetical protein
MGKNPFLPGSGETSTIYGISFNKKQITPHRGAFREFSLFPEPDTSDEAEQEHAPGFSGNEGKFPGEVAAP